MKYSLGLNALCLGARALNSTNLVEAGGPVAKKLAQSVGETVFIGVRDGLRVVFLYKAVGRHAIRFEEQIGASADLHTTALGKAILGALNDDERALLLAQLDFRPSTPSTITDLKSFRKEIARAHAIGYAASDEEHLIGVLGLAAPIRGMWGEVVGAIVVTGPKWRMDASRKDIGRLVVEAAEMISAELGFGPVERTEAALVS